MPQVPSRTSHGSSRVPQVQPQYGTRDEKTRRIASGSQSIVPRRALPRPQTLSQAQLMRDMPETAYYDTSHLPANAFSRASAIRYSQVQRQISAPSPPRSQESVPPVARASSVQVGYSPPLSDRDMLPSQQLRRMKSKAAAGNAMRRTLTIRRASVPRTPRSDNVSVFLPPETDASQSSADSRQNSRGRPLSFEYGPETLTLGPLWQKSTASHADGVVRQDISPTDDSTPTTQTRISAPPQTFEEILGDLERVPTVLRDRSRQ